MPPRPRPRPRVAVVVFPGSNCEQDVAYALNWLGLDSAYVWHGDHSLDGFGAVVLPGGFSYGDYLRCGAIARFSPIMDAVTRFARAGRPVLGICNGFQILAEAHLLPGALLRNAGLKFICRDVALRVEARCDWLDAPTGSVLHLPINHNEGNFVCDSATLDDLRADDRVIVRYCDEEGRTDGVSAPNGALDNIAGITNAARNVFGLMPHPERAVDPTVGGSDGQLVFQSLLQQFTQEVF
ncbi:MAG: phosphoribosylformylglycinamidine synthase subunit PurQ [Actinomycetes bacterium]|nr:phosphoribosylformylglycinamidine synthase subunit PurQ [Actinomycetes bacterium]